MAGDFQHKEGIFRRGGWLAVCSVGLSLLAAGPPVAAQQGGGRVPLGKPEETSYMEMTCVFSSLPPSGYAPVLITVRNDFDHDISFTLQTRGTCDSGRDDHQMSGSISFVAPKEKITQRSVMAPVCPNFSALGRRYSSGSSLLLDLSGIRRSTWTQTSPFIEGQPVVGLSNVLTKDNVMRLNSQRHTSSGRSSYGTNGHYALQFKAEQLPPAWQAYSGLDFLALTGDEWLKLAPGVRSAILQWVHLGGGLDLYGSGKAALSTFGITPVCPNEPGKFGLGTVRMIDWDGKDLAESTMSKRYPDGASTTLGSYPRREAYTVDRGSPWRLKSAIGRRVFNDWKVGVILLLFGILVGPVNLFYFAKAGRRHRLFFTTPIISLGASLLLGMVIFFQDGLGGRGKRFAVAYYNARDAAAYVCQEQVSRTGVLFGSGFQAGEGAVVTQMVLPDSQWTRLKPDQSGTGQRYTASESGQYAGDWFQSRSEQAQMVEAVRSTRGRLELEGTPEAPVLRSNLGFTLTNLWYIDAKGAAWTTAAPVAIGQAVPLTKADLDDFMRWRITTTELASASLADRVRVGLPPHAHFFAVTEDPAAGMVDTLKSIDWAADTVFLWGPVGGTP